MTGKPGRKVGPDGRTERKILTLTPIAIAQGLVIGDGNLSRGVREALRIATLAAMAPTPGRAEPKPAPEPIPEPARLAESHGRRQQAKRRLGARKSRAIRHLPARLSSAQTGQSSSPG